MITLDFYPQGFFSNTVALSPHFFRASFPLSRFMDN